MASIPKPLTAYPPCPSQQSKKHGRWSAGASPPKLSYLMSKQPYHQSCNQEKSWSKSKLRLSIQCKPVQAFHHDLSDVCAVDIS